jgi:hypothetical protein
MKDYQGLAASAGLVQIQRLAILVRQHYIRKVCSHSWTNGTKVNAEIRDCSHGFSSLSRPGQFSPVLLEACHHAATGHIFCILGVSFCSDGETPLNLTMRLERCLLAVSGSRGFTSYGLRFHRAVTMVIHADSAFGRSWALALSHPMAMRSPLANGQNRSG